MMKVLKQMVIRNLKLYLRDKAAVFFSFLSVIIILALYILFLGKMQTDMLSDEFSGVEGLNWLVGAWIMSGLLTVSTVTVPLSAVGKLIDDREHGMIDDFFTAPINRNNLVLSYLISSWVIGFIMVMINFVIGQIYVISQGGELFSLLGYLKIIGLCLFFIVTFSSFFFYLSLFIKSRNAWGMLNTLVGTFIGFLGGIYIPIGVLSKPVQSVMNVLPTAHAVTLMRLVYMDKAVDKVFAGAPQSAFDDYAKIYGLQVTVGNQQLSQLAMFLAMLAFMLIFYVLSILKLKRLKL